MANEKQLALLKQGVDHWNKWRHGNDSIEPNLTGADLTGADLTGADLTGADLTGADLTGADLTRADLHWADLTGADLTRADLTRADLREADLTGADLREADLTGADLTGVDLIGADLIGTILSRANLRRADLRRADLTGVDLTGTILSGANLSRADLTRAKFYETTLGDTDLINTRGLDSCRHDGPSTIDHRTIMRSWPLPLAFLRGCGLSDTLIKYLPSLVNEPLEFYSCFISYSSSDQPFVERVHADLQNKGVRCWFAPHDIQGGKKIHEQIDQAIRVYDKLLLVLSEASINSGWVEFEIRKARKREVAEKRRVLFPIRLMNYEMLAQWECFDADTQKDLAVEIREFFIPDFSIWKDHDPYQETFSRLLRDLKAEATEEQRKKSPREG
jgi:hypothetical protein